MRFLNDSNRSQKGPIICPAFRLARNGQTLEKRTRGGVTHHQSHPQTTTAIISRTFGELFRESAKCSGCSCSRTCVDARQQNWSIHFPRNTSAVSLTDHHGRLDIFLAAQWAGTAHKRFSTSQIRFFLPFFSSKKGSAIIQFAVLGILLTEMSFFNNDLPVSTKN
jgi:hypothetical protein